MIKFKLFLCAALALLAFCPAFGQSASYPLRNEEIFGFAGPASFGSGGVYPLSATEYQGAAFDSLFRVKAVVFKDGKAQSETRFASDGSVLYNISYAYTDEGLLLEIRAADSSGALKWAYRFDYDDGGRLSRETSISFLNGEERIEGEVLFSYSEEGLLAKRETFSANGALTLSETFAYDSAGRVSEKSSHYADGTLLKRETCEYSREADGNVPLGVPVRIRQYDSNGLYETSIFEYKAGALSSVLRYGADSVLKDSEFFYYLGDKVLRRARLNAEGALVLETESLYDWAGNLVMERDASGITLWQLDYPKEGL